LARQHGRDALTPEERKAHQQRKKASRVKDGQRVHNSGLTQSDVDAAIERVKARRAAGIAPKRGILYDLDKLDEGIEQFGLDIQTFEKAIEDAEHMRREWRALRREQASIHEQLDAGKFVEGYSKEPGIDTMPDLN
jgi:hypothetical protein